MQRLAIDETQQTLHGPRSGLRHVQMRVCPVYGDDIGMSDECRRHIRMQIEAHRQRYVPEPRPDFGKEGRLAVGMAFGHHRAVKIQIDAVQRSRISYAGQDHLADMLECRVSDKAARLGCTPQDRKQLDMPGIDGMCGRPGNGEVQT